MTQRNRQSQRVRCFLSCSVRPSDRLLVEAFANTLNRFGFDCRTVGRNDAAPATPDDAVRTLLRECDCLIGVATARFDARDRATPDTSLTFATSYVLQEASAAHQLEMPFIIFRTADVTLQGVTARNIYFDIEPQLRDGKVVIENKPAAEAALKRLQDEARAFRAARNRAAVKAGIGELATWALGMGLLAKVAQSASRPDCYGDFHEYDDEECDDCEHRTSCIERSDE